MDDPGVIANRLVAVAKGIVADAQDVAVNASSSGDYTAKTMVDTFTQSVDIALNGTQKLFNAVMKQEQPADDAAAIGRARWADALAVIARRMVRETGVVAAQATTTMDAKAYTPTEWTKSLIKLADIAVLGTMELAETALIGPAVFEVELQMSEDFTAPGANNRKLRVLTPLARPGTPDAIPAAKLSFYTTSAGGGTELPDGLLDATQTTFCIAVNARDMISGMYVGLVGVYDVDANDEIPSGEAASDMVPVRIGL